MMAPDTWPIPSPEPPGWRLDWPAIDAALPRLAPLVACPQDPMHHAEGDVLTHTRLVAEALAADPGWRALSRSDRRRLFAAALLHDLGKPASTRLEAGRLITPGHARRGAIDARVLLWRLGVPLDDREAICALVRHHLLPFHALEAVDWRRRLLAAAETARLDHLALLAAADALGRISPDRARLLDAVALFREAVAEAGCAHAPYPFPSNHARVRYYRSEDPARDPAYAAYDDTRCEVVVVSGLPGAGKDHWLREHRPELPVVSLDAIRAELGAPPTRGQGAVVAAARERARAYLRAGIPFAWNATNLSRRQRAPVLDLLDAYRVRSRLVHIETTPDRLREQNRHRPNPVPNASLARLLHHWELPDRTEAHAVDLVVNDP